MDDKVRKVSWRRGWRTWDAIQRDLDLRFSNEAAKELSMESDKKSSLFLGEKFGGGVSDGIEGDYYLQAKDQ